VSFSLTRSAPIVALALSVGLVALPACKKAKPTVPDSPAQTPTPAPGPNLPMPGPGAGDSFPPPPQTPVFRGQNPLTATIRTRAEANMRQIGIALHNFESVYGALPAGYADKTGKPGLSWRVAILPFIEQDGLFKQFKFDEPWNSEHNKALVAKMPPMFAPPDQSTNGYTFARGFTGPNTWLPPQAQLGRPGQPLLGIKLIQITDDTANTFLVADAGDAVIWTKPDEMPFAPNNVPKLGGVFDSGTVVGMADGTTKFIPKGADPKMIANAIQINDGNVVKFGE
jgi:hypothetical protein